jgi:ABC-type Fe3+-hydroxamate transport system substrate-binding protein
MALVFDFDSLWSSFTSSPKRVVSLVPSTTESLLAFGLASSLVGVTDYCEIPEELESLLERIGGTKNPDISKILSLKPDLVIANQEENERKFVESLIGADLVVWLTFPKTVTEAVEDLWHLARLFKIERVVAHQLETLERVSEWTMLVEPEHSRARYFCPIWQSDDPEWWMTFNGETYANDILRHCGGVNVFAQRERVYPLAADLVDGDGVDSEGRDTRYPRVSINEILEAEPDVILLPSEPFHFGEDHIQKFRDTMKGTPVVENDAIYLLDGRLITWHGIRIAEALVELPRYFR